jgi:hypothetical protein
MKLAQAERGNERLNAARNARSARVSRGRGDPRRSTANSWRNTKISNSFDRLERPINETSAIRLRTARYANDHSTRPSLDRLHKRAERSPATAEERHRRFSEPYLCHERGKELVDVGEVP